MNKEQELPQGWVRTPINSIAMVNPGSDTSTLPDSTLVSFIPMAAVEAETGRIDTSTWRELSEVRRGYTAFRENDVIFAKITPCMENGKAAVARRLSSRIGFGSTEFHVLRPEDGINLQLLYYYLSRASFRQAARAAMGGSAGQLRVPAVFLADAFYPLPPVEEQQRIVSAIEERFTILDAVATTLQQNKQELKLARASVLKHAVEGKLTEKWRAEHPVSESGSELLKRILAERRAKWEAEQLTKGKDPRKLRYEELTGPDVSGLPELPEGWCWTSLNQLIIYLRNGLSDKPSTEPPGHRILRINAVRPMNVNMDEIRFLNLPEKDVEAYFIEDGDILFTRYNGSLDLLGVAGMVRGCTQPTLHPDKLIRVKIQLSGICPSYVHLASNVGFSRAHIESRARTTAGQTGISGSDLKQMPIPLPSTAEQHQIVTEVERRLSVIEQAEAAIETSLKRIERARQSLLERAFAGRLVPQDPNDEPASVLLERIQEERKRRVVEGKQRGKNGGVKAAQGKKTKEKEFVPQWQLLRDAKQSGSMDGSLSKASAHEDGVSERCEVGQDEVGREELGDLVQMPLFSVWD